MKKFSVFFVEIIKMLILLRNRYSYNLPMLISIRKVD